MAEETPGSTGSRAASRYALLASAVAGRKVAVVVGEPELSHTDGETIYAAAAEPDAVRDAVVVQAALLGAGSFDPRTVVRLAGRKRLRNRYLTLEVVRAMSVLGTSAPRIVAERVARVYTGPVPGS